MEKKVITLEGKQIEAPTNPYAGFSNNELKTVINQSKKAMAVFDQQTFTECAKKITSRDDIYLESLYEVRDGILTIKRQVEQVEEVVLERAESMPTVSKKALKEWRALRTSCTIVNKIGARSFERTTQTINDYRHAFPNEKATSLKKLVQVGAITAFVTNIAGLMFGDSLKAKGIAAGGAIAAAALIDKVEALQHKAGSRAPVRRTELKAYEIRQVYGYLS